MKRREKGGEGGVGMGVEQGLVTYREDLGFYPEGALEHLQAKIQEWVAIPFSRIMH